MLDQKRFGENVRNWRKAKGWSQDVFAHRSGLHRADVGAIERGERNVTLRTMRTIADTLGVKIADLTIGLLVLVGFAVLWSIPYFQNCSPTGMSRWPVLIAFVPVLGWFAFSDCPNVTEVIQ
jgi:transcriptional regulator with XRE-family HTH domain